MMYRKKANTFKASVSKFQQIWSKLNDKKLVNCERAFELKTRENCHFGC